MSLPAGGEEPIEEFLDELLRTMPGSAREVRRTLAEAEAHLLESADRFEADGLRRPDAERAAVAAFGPTDVVAGQVGALDPRDLVRPLVLLGAVGLLSIGASGVLAAAMRLLWGARFLAGDLPGSAYTAARCADFQEYFPGHGCLDAAALHHADEVVTYRLAAGVLGLILVLAWRLLPPRRPLPRGLVGLGGAGLFGAAALACALQTLNTGAGGWSGAGQWVSASVVAAAVAAGYAVPLARAVRQPRVPALRHTHE